MPIPKPTTEESREDFIQRCMGDDTMNEEYPDGEQRLAVCSTSWNDNKSYTNKMNLKQKWAEYQKGGEQPEIYIPVSVKQVDGVVKATITEEIVDRDGEVVIVKGIEFDKEKGVPLINSHNAFGDITQNVLGRAKNIRRRSTDGVPRLEADLIFSSTRAGQEAKALVEDGSIDSVSIGFGVKEFDPENDIIPRSELFEVSLVAIPSNPKALIEARKDLEKKLTNYDKIHPVIKEYRALFMKDLAEMIGLEKSGNEILDIKSLHDILMQKLQAENQPSKKTPKVENPRKRVLTLT